MGYATFAKIDLHLHLDGSITPECLIRLARKEKIELPVYDARKLESYLTPGRSCRDLNMYLKCFELPVAVLQTEEALAEGTKDLVKRLKDKGIVYAEIRFAPQLHTRNGLTQAQVTEAVLSGIEREDIRVQTILCCMRGADNEKENVKTVETAARYLGNGVAAVDLAGAEALYSTGDFLRIFEVASSYQVPFTIHAGEAAGPESIRQALAFGASRIGHGVRAAEDNELMRELKERGTVLEMCPTSNLQTKAVGDLWDYPLRTFLERGIKVTVNSDNMTVSDTSVPEEFALLYHRYGLKDEEAKKLMNHAVDGAFLSPHEKDRLKTMLRKEGTACRK